MADNFYSAYPAASGGGGGAGTVTSIASGTGLTGGPITTAGTLSLANTTVAPGNYTNATITVDSQGRITLASNGSGGTGNTLSIPTTTSPSSGVILQNSIPVFHTFGNSNFFFGSNAGNFTTSGTGLNLGLGANALNALTTGVANVAIGNLALSSTTTGGSNIAIGYNALAGNTAGNNLVGIGNGALASNTGASNIAIGFGAGGQNTSGTFNTFIGENAGSTNTTASGVTVIGPYANVTGTGADNTVLGFQAARFLTTGAGVTAIGGSAGYDTSAGGVANATGSNNTYLGFQSNGTAGNFSNSTALGYQSRITASNQVVLGNASVTEVYVPGQIKIVGGVPGVGKVLTSDAVGLASWQTAGGGGGGANTTLSNLTAPTAINQNLNLSGNQILGVSKVEIKATGGYIGYPAPLYVGAIDEAISVGGALGAAQSTGFSFLAGGYGNAGFRWTNDGSKDFVLEDASNSYNPSTWYSNILGPVNFKIRNGDLKVGASTLLSSAASTYWNGTGPALIFGDSATVPNAIVQTRDEFSGNLTVASGARTNPALNFSTGNVEIRSGDNYSTVVAGKSGEVRVYTGDQYGNRESGQLNLGTGSSSGFFSGDVSITTGNVSGTNTPGSIYLRPSRTGTGLASKVIVEAHLCSSAGGAAAPTIAVSANAGTGATASLSQSTDTAGKITITTGTVGVSTGSYATITFNRAYQTAPICLMTPANSTLSSSVYVTSTTTTMGINFAISGGISSTYVINYFCIETQ